MLDLSYILLELLRNSIEAKSTSIRIVFNNQEDSIFLLVEDNGISFIEDASFLPQVSTKGQGRGLGLLYIKETIEKHKGRIEYNKNSISIQVDNIDIGKIEDSIACILLEDIDLQFDYTHQEKQYRLHLQGRCGYEEIMEIKKQIKEV